MPEPLPDPTPDPFRAWLNTRRAGELAAALGLSRQTVSAWRNGGRVHPNHHDRVKWAAREDGVTLTSDDLLFVPPTI